MGNCRPKKEKVTKEISHWYPSPTNPLTYISSGPAEFDYKFWHEVGGQNDNKKLITNGSKLEKLYRTRLYSPRGENADGDVEYKWEYVYQQKYDVKIMEGSDANDKELAGLDDPENEYTVLGYDAEGLFEGGDPIYYNKPIFKRQCKANTVYDEQYFYHVFNWPSSISVSRKVGGIKKITTNSTATTTTAGDPPSSSTANASNISYEPVTGTVSGNLTVNGVDSEIENAPEGLIYYHGGTFDNKIFFTYEPDANSDGTLKVVAEGDVINGWTVDKVINYVTDKALRRRVPKSSGKNKSPSFVFVNDLIDAKGKVSSVSSLPSAYTGSIDDYYIVDDNEDNLNQLYYQWNGTSWIGPVNVTGILVGDKAKGKGVSPGTVVTEVRGRKVFLSKPLRVRKLRKITFVNNVINKVNASTVCYAELSGSGSDFTADTFYSINDTGGSSSSASVRHVFNDNSNNNIELSTTGPITVEARSLSDPGNSNNSEQSKHYLVTFNNSTTIKNTGDIIIQIPENLTASGVSSTFSIGKIELVNNKSFKIWFKSNTSSTNSFVRSWNINIGTTSNSNKIKVVAGKGILTRSAIVGIYAARNKRYLEYSPMFYTRDEDCEKVYTEDSNASYIVGDIILEDQSLLYNDVELVVEPKTDIAYQINKVFWDNFGMPATKSAFESILKRYPDDSKYLEMEAYIINTTAPLLNNKLVAQVLDSTCNDPIYPTVEKIYYPYKELGVLQDSFTALATNTFDPCSVTDNPKGALSVDELQQLINSNLTNKIAAAGMVLPEEMYKQVISNENSLMNRLTSAVTTIQDSVSKIQQIPNLPPMLEGENEAPINLVIETIRRMPPKFGILEYLINDVIFDSDNSLNPNAVENNPYLTIKSIPAFTGNLTSSSADFTVQKNTKTVGTVTNAIDTFKLTQDPPTPPSAGIPFQIPGATMGPYSVGTVEWAEPGPDGTPGEKDVDNKQFIKHKTTTGARPYPEFLWKADVNYQLKFPKIANFRVNEISSIVSEALSNKGNPYQDDPVYAELSEDITGSSTSIKIKGNTNNFMSSGFLLIPKYILKQSESDLRNASKHYYYLGEEIIYYKNKTANSFENCIRAQFGTNSTFEVVVPTADIESGFLYTIQSLGNTDWASLGAPAGYSVGTTFKAVKDGTTGSGTAYIFGSTLKPFDDAPKVNTVFHSYQKRNYIVQFWPYKLRTDTSSI